MADKSNKHYRDRKARMDRDPAFAGRVLFAQMESRRRRKQREWEAHIERFGDAACQHVYPNDRRCWKSYPHQHENLSHA